MPARADESGFVEGFVVDTYSAEPAVGVTVVLTGPDVGEVALTTLTDEAGRYRIDGVPAGTYALTYYYGDAVTRRDGVVVGGGIGASVTADIDTSLILSYGCSLWLEEPPIPLVAPNATTSSSTHTKTLWPPFIATVGDTMDINPQSFASGDGVAFRGGPADDNDVSLLGLPADANLLLDFVEEVTINESLALTHWPATGGTASAVPRAGTNERRGTVFARIGDGRAELGAEMGGPLLRDELWYHVGVAPRRADGESSAQAVARLDYAPSFDHRATVWGAHLPTSDSVAAVWRSMFDDGRSEVIARAGAMADRVDGASTVSTGGEYKRRAHAMGSHELVVGADARNRIGESRAASAVVHDRWEVRGNLVVELGVRYDRLALGRESTAVDPWACMKLGVCSAGSDAATIDGIAPRVGAVWDWTREGRSRLYASAGRHHRLSGYDAFDGNLVVPNLELERVDEYGVAVDYEIMDATVAGVSYAHRRYGATLETVELDGGRTRALANPGDVDPVAFAELEAELAARPAGDPTRARLARRLAAYEAIDALDGGAHDYDGVAMFVKHRGNDLDLSASYAYGYDHHGAGHGVKLTGVYRWLDSGDSWISTGARLRGDSFGGEPFELEMDLHLGYSRELGCSVDQLTFYIDAFDVGGDEESVTAGGRATF